MKRNAIKTLALALICLLAAAGCTKAPPEDAIKKAVMDYLATRPGLDVAKMDVSVTNVTINNDHAEADVKFQVKGGGPAASMAIHYSLVREGEAWKVQASPGGHPGSGGGATPGTGASPHGDGGAPPTAGAGEDKAGSGPGFHPDTSKPPTTKQ